MSRQKEANILGEIIRLARTGLTQASIASHIGVKPSKVYKLCKLYGIKTRYMVLRDKAQKPENRRPEQLLLPM